jgi:octaprenyl-diphosphate synthase
MVIEDRGFDRVRHEEVLRLAEEQGGLERARQLAARYADAARERLTAFEPSPYRDALAALPDFVLGRDR